MADPKHPRKFSEEFKRQIVQLYDNGKSVLRTVPTFPEDSRRNPEGEGLSRMDALRAMTTNVAYMWHAEDRMGSLSIGKLANMAVFDKDLLEGDIEDIAWARCLATIVDGELAYEIGSGGPVGPTVKEMLAAV